jgi:TDG/mug DNA glycosylase family protein
MKRSCLGDSFDIVKRSSTQRTVGLPPIADKFAETLVLGSFPGSQSLERGQYYANARNRFWAVAHRLWAIDPNLEYSVRCDLVIGKRVALWDVIQSCERDGSLDSKILGERPNDFAAFLADHPEIHTVCFNGQRAYRSRELVEPPLESWFDSNDLIQLPSTSPANARWSDERLMEGWRTVHDRLLRRPARRGVATHIRARVAGSRASTERHSPFGDAQGVGMSRGVASDSHMRAGGIGYALRPARDTRSRRAAHRQGP